MTNTSRAVFTALTGFTVITTYTDCSASSTPPAHPSCQGQGNTSKTNGSSLTSFRKQQTAINLGPNIGRHQNSDRALQECDMSLNVVICSLVHYFDDKAIFILSNNIYQVILH